MITINIPADYSTWAAAYAAIPATLTDATEVVIDTSAAHTFNEQISFAKTTSATNTMLVRTSVAGRKATFWNVSYQITSSSQYVTFRDLYAVDTGSVPGFRLLADNCNIESCGAASYRGTSGIITVSAASCKVLNTVVVAGQANSNGACLQLNSSAVSYLVSNCTFYCIECVNTARAVIYLNGSGGTAVGTFKNNVIIATISSTGHLVHVNSTIPAGTVWNYNYYGIAGGTNVFRVNGVDYASMAAWNTATGMDANSVQGPHQPLVNAIPAVLLSAGTTEANVTRDYAGAARTDAKDIGVLELVEAASVPAMGLFNAGFN